jgi:hypothetical protein
LKAPITRRALIQRISRALKKDNPHTALKATRGQRERRDLGDYYIYRRNVVTETHIKLEELGKRLGVLKPYERLEDD